MDQFQSGAWISFGAALWPSFSTADPALTPLRGVTWSVDLIDLDGSGVRDLRPIADIPTPRAFSINHTAVDDLRPIAGFTQLDVLRAGDSQVRELVSHAPREWIYALSRA